MKLILWGALDQGTGFGSVTIDLGRALMAAGVDLRVVAINDVEKAPDDFTVIPLGDPKPYVEMGGEKGAHAWLDSVKRKLASYDGWTADAILVTGDPASIIRSNIPSLLPPGMAAWHYCPVEGTRLPPSWLRMWEQMQPIAMCGFGSRELSTILGYEPPFVYHGVNQTDFWPVSSDRPIVLKGEGNVLRVLRSKDECKAVFGLPPDATVMLRTDRLMPRKRYGSMLRCIAPVLERNPKTIMLMHCRSIDEGGNLDDFRSHYPPHVAMRMMVTGYQDMGITIGRPTLNALYNAADLYLSTGAEGFGLTIAEALACGVPVVGMDYTSVPEVVGDAGVLVPLGFRVESLYAYDWGNVHEPKYTEAVEYLVTHKARRMELGRLGPKHMASFTWASAAEKFLSIMSPVEVAV